MPITIPEFVQFQAPLFPLRGLWNSIAAEGDRFVNAEIDWGSPGLFGVSCVQFQLSGNSPVAFSQIAALSVDNSRCGSSVDFIFPDSGFILTVPAFNQGVYPVFTNALMFYVNAPKTVLGDITIAQILNSVPPPVAIQPSGEQQSAGVAGVNMSANGSTQVVPASVSGTLQGFVITYTAVGTAGGESAILTLYDGTGKPLWQGSATVAEANQPQSMTIPVTGLDIRFTNGITLQVASSTLNATSPLSVNVYYSVP